jgi:hypothetical protein
VLLFRIYQVSGKLRLNLHVRATPKGVWVRFPYPKYTASSPTSDDVRIAVIGVEDEQRLCLIVKKINAGVEELEAMEISPSLCGTNPAPRARR